MDNGRGTGLVDLLETINRKYRYDTYQIENMQKCYNFVDTGIKLLSFAQDETGSISDTFIMYAIAMLGIADEKSILLFLRNVKKHHPELNIADMTTIDALKSRLRILQKFGFLFEVRASFIKNQGEKGILNQINFYFITREANDLINHKLSRRIPYNQWLMAVPLSQMVEWAACSYVSSMISHHTNYVEYLDGHFQSKLLGKYYFPSEIRFNDGSMEHYVAFIGAYFYKDTGRQTDTDFIRLKIEKINAIKNYLAVRAPKAYAEVVVVVDTKDDLNNMADAIERTGTLLEYLPRIYFTGEGILQNTQYFEEAFFIMVHDDENNTVDFIKTVPIFLKKIKN